MVFYKEEMHYQYGIVDKFKESKERVQISKLKKKKVRIDSNQTDPTNRNLYLPDGFTEVEKEDIMAMGVLLKPLKKDKRFLGWEEVVSKKSLLSMVTDNAQEKHSFGETYSSFKIKDNEEVIDSEKMRYIMNKIK